MINLENATVAIQKSGRLTERSLEAMNERFQADFPVTKEPFDKTRELTDKNTGITVVGYGNGDLLKAVVCGQVDLGIAGEDKVDELLCPETAGWLPGTLVANRLANLAKLGTLGGDEWQLVIARQANQIDTPMRRIATSFPNLTRKWLQNRPELDPDIARFGGGIEAIGRRNGYDTICEIVHSGESLAANSYVETNVVGRFLPVIVGISRPPLQSEVFDVVTAPSILDVMSERQRRRKQSPTSSESSRLVSDPNAAIKKISSETGELIAEIARGGDIEWEAADLLYSICAGLVGSDGSIRNVLIELASRYNEAPLLDTSKKDPDQ